MNPYIKKIFTQGVQSKQDIHTKRDVIFVNQVVFALIIVSGVIFLANLVFGFYSRSLVSMTMAFLLMLTFVFQRKHKYFTAKVLTIFVILGGSFFSTLLFGPEAKTQYYAFPTFCISMILFSDRYQQVVLFLIHMISFGFLSLYLSNNLAIFPGQDTTLLAYFHIPMIFTAVFVTLSEYVLHYKRYEKRMIELMKTLRDHGELLEIEKTKFQVQTDLLQMSNDQLVKEMRHKEIIQEKLVESNSSLEQFAYVASHDLKEPLRTIGSFSQLLKRKLEGKLNEETGEYFYYVIDGVQRMTNLLDDLLAFSRLNRTQELNRVDLNDCIELNIHNLRNSIEKNNGKVVAAKLPVLKANQSQMNQLFQNLISNGLKFKRDEDPKVEINYEDKGDHYLFSIKDNGIGIEDKFREKIFVIFQRLAGKGRYEGTGIGLAICKKIVQNHGGDIWIESTVGEGTTFFFTIAKTPMDPEPKMKERKEGVNSDKIIPQKAGQGELLELA